MKSPLVLATLLAILTTNAATAQGEGDKYVIASLNKLLAARTIECDIRIDTFVDGKKYAAWGNYAEQVLPQAPPNSFLRSNHRLEITFSLNPSKPSDAEPNRMTLVSYVTKDGEKHQMDRYSFIEGTKSFTTIDLKRVEAWLKASGREGTFRQVSEVRNLGGLAGMMRQICRFYEFSSAKQEDLHLDETIPTLKLTGTLRSMNRKELLTQFGGLDKKNQYPADFPSDIEIWLGRHNDFPYKICYLRRASEKSDQKTMLYQEAFYKVMLDGTLIPASRFAPLTIPDDVFSVVDETDNFIKSLKL